MSQNLFDMVVPTTAKTFKPFTPRSSSFPGPVYSYTVAIFVLWCLLLRPSPANSDCLLVLTISVIIHVHLNKGRPTLMTLALLCQFTALLVQPALGYHITNSQSRYITPTRLKSAQYSLHNNAPSSRKLLKMDVLTSEEQ